MFGVTGIGDGLEEVRVICRALEQSAAKNALPVEFFALASSELASGSNPFDLRLHHPLNNAGQVFLQP